MMTPYFEDDWLTILEGDCREVLRSLPAESVNCVVTSPPYFGLRDYGIAPTVWGGDGHVHEWGEPLRLVHTAPPGTEKQASNHGANGVSSSSSCGCGAWSGVLGLEPTPELYVAHMVEVFREVRRVLRKDGTVWLNLGDSYSSGLGEKGQADGGVMVGRARKHVVGLKPKDRIMVPARVALALQADGWWLRDEIVWSKPNPMPSSVTDRTTPAHEMVYLLTKSARYWYDAAAVVEPLAESSIQRINQPTFDSQTGGPKDYGNGTNPNQSARKALENLKAIHTRTPAGWNRKHEQSNLIGRYDDTELDEPREAAMAGRNRRSVWTVATQPYPEAHFATFPEALVEPMVKAGCPPQVCSECGAPWERVMSERPYPKELANAVKAHGGVGNNLGGQKHQDWLDANPRELLGWQPTCKHDAATRPGVVLDIFAGSGTVGLVAQRLSRRAILVDLNAEYLRQCLTRNQAIPLGLLTEAG